MGPAAGRCVAVGVGEITTGGFSVGIGEKFGAGEYVEGAVAGRDAGALVGA